MRFLKPVLVSSVIASMALLCSCNKANNSKTSVSNDSTEVETVVAEPSVAPSQTLDVVYMNVDTVLKNYTLAKELTAQLTKKQEKSANSLQSKQTKLQQDMLETQKKYEAGLLVSQVSIQEAQQKLAKQEQELQALEQRLTKEMLEETEKMNTRLRDSLNSLLKQYQKENRYKMVLSNNGNDNVLWADSSLNITNIVLNDLNARYQKK